MITCALQYTSLFAAAGDCAGDGEEKEDDDADYDHGDDDDADGGDQARAVRVADVPAMVYVRQSHWPPPWLASPAALSQSPLHDCINSLLVEKVLRR